MNKKKALAEELAEYLRFMEAKNLHELEIKEGDFHIKLVRQSRAPVIAEISHHPGTGKASSGKPEKPAVEEGHHVKAPIAGVFYRARSPQSPAFVNIGDNVTSEQTMCIIEAMKVMNEIVAGAHGRVTKILVENGKPVESGQTLFILKQE
jgi:acetyl-CoA carboxylase biotin carboxyl carrier protein